MNKKGFTIIELLVAFVILFILMAGFLKGILLYMDYQINNGLKDRAGEIALRMSSQIQTARLNATLNATSCSANSTNPFFAMQDTPIPTTGAPPGVMVETAPLRCKTQMAME
jgi:prepilin-type N-terminal cleavage/methylation domain